MIITNTQKFSLLRLWKVGIMISNNTLVRCRYSSACWPQAACTMTSRYPRDKQATPWRPLPAWRLGTFRELRKVMCFKADAFTHTMTSYMRKRESKRNGGEGGRKRNKRGIDEHRWQRKRIVVGRKRESYIAGRKHLHLIAGRKRWELGRKWKNVDGRKTEGAGRKRRVWCIRSLTFERRIGGEEAWALNTRRHGLGHRNFIAEEVGE